MSEQYKQTGEIHQIGQTQTFDSGFTKRLCVLKYQNGEYENFLAVDFIKDKCATLDNYHAGQQITISFNLRSNENPKKEGQWFTNPTAWRVDAEVSQAPERQHQQAGHQMPQGAADVVDMPDGEPLPF